MESCCTVSRAFGVQGPEWFVTRSGCGFSAAVGEDKNGRFGGLWRM